MKHMKVRTIRAAGVAAVAALLLMAAGMGRAAEAVIPLIVLEDVPLPDAIRNLARQAGFNYILDPRVPGCESGPGPRTTAPKVNLRKENLSAREALSAVLREHKLMMVTSPATTVTRIAPDNLGIRPVPASQVGTNAATIPLVVMADVPLADAINNLAKSASLKVDLDPKVSAPAFGGRVTISVRWEAITPRQALAALLDNYGLVMTEDKESSTARISLAPER